MTTWVVHGFNVWDGGEGSVGALLPFIDDGRLHSYGWTGLVGLPCANSRAVRSLLETIEPGDSIVAHSNGSLIAWQTAQIVPLSAVVCINPALRRDTVWPDSLPTLCLHNSTDWVVQLGRVWGRLTDWDGVKAAGWGAAGRYGFTQGQDNVKNWDTAAPYWGRPVAGHSGMFKEPRDAEYWGGLIRSWLRASTPSSINGILPGAVSIK